MVGFAVQLRLVQATLRGLRGLGELGGSRVEGPVAVQMPNSHPLKRLKLGTNN